GNRILQATRPLLRRTIVRTAKEPYGQVHDCSGGKADVVVFQCPQEYVVGLPPLLLLLGRSCTFAGGIEPVMNGGGLEACSESIHEDAGNVGYRGKIGLVAARQPDDCS